MAAEPQGAAWWQWHSPYGEVRINYVEKGVGSKHVLLIHGFGANTYTWHAIIEPLAAAGYHVWAMDLLGFGLSDKPAGVPYGFELFLAQIEAFMEAKQIPRADLVGNSMGGGLALEMAIMHPTRVKSLTLITALGYPLELPYYFSIARRYGTLLRPMIGKTFMRLVLKHLMYNPKLITDAQVEAYLRPVLAPGGLEAIIRTLAGFDNTILEKLSARFNTIKIPVLIIWGENDTLIPVADYWRFTKDFPHAEKLLIPHCGHIPQEECPKPVTEALLRFLKNERLTSGSSS